MFAVLVVAFIAGYSIVSFVVRKWKEGPGDPSLKQGRLGSNSTSEDTSTETGDAYQPSHKEDQG
jgi:hypothetical protein